MHGIRHRELALFDVLYVPGLTKNLISVSTLEDKGFQVKFRDRKGVYQDQGFK